MLYAYPYLLLFFFYLYWYYIHKNRYQSTTSTNLKSMNYVDLIAMIVYLFFYGLRGFVFTDCFQYYDYFIEEAGQNISYDFVNFRFEPGYVLCNYAIHLLTSDFFVFQFIWTTIDVLLIMKILKSEVPQYYLLSFALLIPFFDGVQMNLFRNIKGILICFYALRYVRARNFFKYSMYVLLATSIHVSSIIFLPFYFIVNRDLRFVQVVLLMVSVVMYFSDLGFLNNIFLFVGVVTGGGKIDQVMLSYVDSNNSAGFTLGFIYRISLFIAMLCMYKKIATKNLIMLNIAMIYLFCFTAFNSILVMRDRFGQMFAMGIVCILPLFLTDSYKWKYRKIFVSFNLLCLLGQVYVQHNNAAAKYENVVIGVSDRHRAEIRVTEAAEVYTNN